MIEAILDILLSFWVGIWISVGILGLALIPTNYLLITLGFSFGIIGIFLLILNRER